MHFYLGDPQRRREYDASLKQRELTRDWPVQDEILFSDFEIVDDKRIYDCRCGGEYVLSFRDIEFLEPFVQCDSCSLCIKVLYEKVS